MREFLRRAVKVAAISVSLIFVMWMIGLLGNRYTKSADEITLNENERYDMSIWLDTSNWGSYLRFENACTKLENYIEGDESIGKQDALWEIEYLQAYFEDSLKYTNKATDLIEKKERALR